MLMVSCGGIVFWGSFSKNCMVLSLLWKVCSSFRTSPSFTLFCVGQNLRPFSRTLSSSFESDLQDRFSTRLFFPFQFDVLSFGFEFWYDRLTSVPQSMDKKSKAEKRLKVFIPSEEHGLRFNFSTDLGRFTERGLVHPVVGRDDTPFNSGDPKVARVPSLPGAGRLPPEKGPEL